MFKRIILSISVAVVLIIAAPTKAQAAFPDGDAVGAMLMGGWPVGGAIGVTGQSSKVPVMFGGTVRFGVGHFGVGFTADWWGFKHNLDLLEILTLGYILDLEELLQWTSVAADIGF